jgi:uncharacterized protein
MKLRILPERFAVSRLEPNSELPAWAFSGTFRTVSWTRDELSIVCEEPCVPPDIRSERGWRAFMVVGPLDFNLTGLLLQLAQPLAEAGISIFAMSTFDTDYVLVKEASLPEAKRALEARGHQIE